MAITITEILGTDSISGSRLTINANFLLLENAYNDLENTLSSIIKNCRLGKIEEDALKLSRTVISTILSASNPITGETLFEQKQKSQGPIFRIVA